MSIKLGKRDVLLGNLWQAGGVGGRIPKNWLSPRKKTRKRAKFTYVRTPLSYAWNIR